MKILNIQVTSGPNYWSVKRHKLVIMLLDIEEYETKPTNEIDGFYWRLKKALPGLYEHHCSEGSPGGFFKRVKRGTWMGHVVEHIALELQTLAGLNVSFGRTRGSGVEGQYYVVFDCIDEVSGRLAANISIEIAQNLAKDRPVNIENAIKKIEEAVSQNATGPSTESILKEAKSRHIPTLKLDDSSTWQLGYGCYRKTIEATIASTTSQIAVTKACDKIACKRLFNSMAVPVPSGKTIYSRDELSAVIDKLGFPLVIKPASGNQGRGITTNIKTETRALKAYDAARKVSEEVIAERHIPGYDFRLLVINHKFIAAAKRTPAHVVGDGHSTIAQLIDQVNDDSRRGTGHNKVLTKIEVDSYVKINMRKQGHTLDTVLAENEVLYLQQAANLSMGGTAENITNSIHPKVLNMAERVSKIIDLDICGIDIIAPTLDQPLSTTGGKVLEVNAAPGFRMHLAPSKGNSVNVAAPVVDMLFPDKSPSRIPITAVTGTNGKTTTTRLIAHILGETGVNVGFTSTDGIYVNDEQMMSGDCGGPKSAEFVLKDPTVEAAVLECARGGILREGLGFGQCDVGVVTNVTSDHLGISGIDTLEKMARVKSVVPESVHPGGYAVLNADDDRVYAMRENLSCKIILFSMNAENPRLLAHRKAGNVCVAYQDRTIVIWNINKTYTIENIENIPLSFGGRADFMVENILAATAAAYALKINLADICKALNSFNSSPQQAPGRMNIFEFNNFDVMIDYAHNIGGLKAIKNFLEHSDYSHRVGIIAGIGDRREEDNLALGRLAGEIFDEVIVREDDDLRGKNPGELTEVLKRGITGGTSSPQITTIANEKKALSHAINNAKPDSIIVLCAENIPEILTLTKQLQTQHNYRKQLKMKQLHQYDYEALLNS